jgi:hypothetical protein
MELKGLLDREQAQAKAMEAIKPSDSVKGHWIISG